MLTLERAAELVSALREARQNDAANDLFCHFDDVFRLSERDMKCGTYIKQFAELCGYSIATGIHIVEE